MNLKQTRDCVPKPFVDIAMIFYVSAAIGDELFNYPSVADLMVHQATKTDEFTIVVSKMIRVPIVDGFLLSSFVSATYMVIAYEH